MKEKPPILNAINWTGRPQKKNLLEAQRDADVKWYEGTIEEKIIEDTLQYAKAQVAREIFEEAEQRCEHLLPNYRHKPKRDCPLCWQAFKKSKGVE